MWILTRQIDGKVLRLLCNKEYTIGRGRDCDIATGTDPSVSRKHMIISCPYDAALITDLDTVPELKIKDLGSAYGTSVNSGPKLLRDTWTAVKDGDEFTIGEKNSWNVKWEDVCVTCSSLVSPDAKKLRNCLQSLGGKILSTWCGSSTHLVVSKIVFTQKIQEALISAKPIVSVSYFEKWIEALRRHPSSDVSELNTEDHLPPVQDPSIAFNRSVFLPNEERKRIFAGKVFLFPTRLMKDTHASTIVLGGGASYLVDEYKPNKLETESTVLIDWPKKAGHPTDFYLALLAEVKNRGQRSIPDKDIGYAIAECSTQRYCNPNPVCVKDRVFAPLVGGTRKEETLTRQEILAAETQPLLVGVNDEVIPTGFSKRILEESLDSSTPPDKRQRLCHEETQVTQQVIPGALPGTSAAEHPSTEVEQNGGVAAVSEKVRAAVVHSKSHVDVVEAARTESAVPAKRMKLEDDPSHVSVQQEEVQQRRTRAGTSRELQQHVQLPTAEVPVAQDAEELPESPDQQDMFTDSPPAEEPRTSKKLPIELASMNKKQAKRQEKPVLKASNGTLNSTSRRSTTSVRNKTGRSNRSGNDVSQLLSPEEFGKRLVIASDRPRIREMRISRFRDGRWITEPEVVTQARPPPRVIFNVSKL